MNRNEQIILDAAHQYMQVASPTRTFAWLDGATFSVEILAGTSILATELHKLRDEAWLELLKELGVEP